MINSIGSGGAERVLGQILEEAGVHGRGYECHLALLDDEPEYRAMPMLDGRHCLVAQGSLVRSAVRLRRLVKWLRPAVVVTMLVRANMAAVFATVGVGTGAVLGERMHLGSHLAGRYRGAALFGLRLLPRLLYRRADRVVAVSSGVARDLIRGFGVPARKVVTVNNPYDPCAIAEAGVRPPSIALPDSYLIAVGRLVEAKGFADLIEAYRRADPSAALVILGDGPERERLLGQVAATGLQGRVLLPGYLSDPFPVVARARALVSASRNEGFPNAIAEAMALGRPVLATDCPSGPAELLGAGAGERETVVEAPWGLVVPERDIAALAAGLRRLEDDELRARLGAAARRRIADFAADRIVADYWAVITAVAARYAPPPA